jgi:hypothetical protein
LHHVGYTTSNTTFVQKLNKFLSNQVQQVGILCHTYYYEPHKMHLSMSFRFNLGDHNTSYSSLCHNICEDFAPFVHLSKLAWSFQETQLCGGRDVHYVTNQDKCGLAFMCWLMLGVVKVYNKMHSKFQVKVVWGTWDWNTSNANDHEKIRLYKA